MEEKEVQVTNEETKIEPKVEVCERKGLEQPWLPDIEKARELVSQGESKRKVARYLGIPESTLRKRLKRISKTPSSGVQITFTPQQETELIKYCVAFHDMSGGLTFTALRKITFNFVEEHHIENNFNKDTRMADVEFINEFLTRHRSVQQLVRAGSRSSEQLDIGQEQLRYFYNCLKEQLVTHQFTAARIYNVAQLELSPAPAAAPETNGAVASGGEPVSVLLCVSAAGHWLPPTFLFGGTAGWSVELLAGAPPCSIAVPPALDTLLEWLRHFQRHVHSCHRDPALLVLDDNTLSRSKSAEEFCRFHGIVPLNLPSGRLQPLSMCVFERLRLLYSLEGGSWCRARRLHALGTRDVAPVFRKAFFRAATMDSAVEGFRVTGICPFDRDIVSETCEITGLCQTIFQNVVCEYEAQVETEVAALCPTLPD